MPAPPSSAIIPDKKGKDKAICKLIDGHYIWIEDSDNIGAIPKNLFDELPQDIKNIADVDSMQKKVRFWKYDKLEQWKKENNYTCVFNPLTPTQRAILVNSIRRAEERKAKGWQSQLPMIAGLGAVVIIVIALLIFYGNIAKPSLEMADKAIAFQTAQNEGLTIMKEIKNDIQVIKSESGTQPRTTPGG
jgi:hypothetical protein